MAKTTDQVVIEILAETRKLRAEMSKADKSLNKTKKKAKETSSAFKMIGTAVAGLGLGLLAAQTVQTVRQFEDLEATLRAVTGGADGAALSMKVVRDFTKGTTFQIQEVASAFIRLRQTGIIPTTDVLTDFGNLAAGMGKSIDQLAQAAFNATTGEMEMLKQFGIKAKLEGDKIVATFNNNTKVIERSNDAIIEYLQSLGREEFPTALAERLNTLSGAISNTKDAAAEFMVAIGEGGLRDSLTDVAKELTNAFNESHALAEAIGAALGLAVKGLAAPLMLVVNNLKEFSIALSAAAGAALVANFAGVVQMFVAVAGAIRKAALNAAAFMGLTTSLKGALKAVAGAGLAVTGVTLALNAAEEDNNETLEDTDALNKKLTDTLTTESEKIKQLITDNKEFLGVITRLKKETSEGALFDLVSEEGIDNQKKKIEEMFDTFVDNKKKALAEANKDEAFGSTTIGDFFDITGALPSGFLEGKIPDLRKEFFDTAFDGMTENEVMDFLTVALVAPVDKVGAQVKDILGTTVGEFDHLKDVIADDEAFAAIFTEEDLQKLDMTLKQAQDFVKNFVEVSEMELSSLGEQILEAFEAGAPELADSIEELSKSVVEPIFKTLKKMKEIPEDMSFEDFFDQYAAGVKKIQEEANPAKTALELLDQAMEDLMGNQANMAQVQETLNAAVAAGTITQDQANAGYREFLRTLGPTGEAMANIGERVESLSATLASDFVGALREGEDALDAFENFAGNVIQAVIEEFMRLMVIQPIVDAILGHFSISAPKGGTGTGVTKNQGGGRIGAGQPTLVGESGPELFVPSSHGNILNSMNTRNAGGGGTVHVTQNLNFATGVSQTVRAEVMGMLPQIAEVSKAAVADAANRGGNFRRRLVGG